MNISDKLTQQQFQEILFNIYKKGQESEKMEAAELINEIKRQIMSSIMHRPK
ncbi:ribulose bisphosphate carboxylase small subunit [Bacillus fengqiuensis]|nr:ribulose bisphosphate carboxylase small subunit [Bacillus fengqiuensis]